MSELEWMKIFGDNLRDMLIENDMSQNELARAIGVSQATVNRYIKGQIMPSTKVLVNICHVLDADDEWIKVSFTDKKKNQITKLLRIENISEVEIIENDIQ